MHLLLQWILTQQDYRFLKNNIPPAGGKSVEELARIIQLTQKPFILKGIMTVQGAQKALEAGAKAIIGIQPRRKSVGFLPCNCKVFYQKLWMR